MEAQPTSPTPFLLLFDNIIFICAFISGALVFLVYSYYKMRVSFIHDPKEKYDFINAHEISWFKRVFFFIGLTLALLINLYGSEKILTVGLLFFVRAFFAHASIDACLRRVNASFARCGTFGSSLEIK